MAFRILIAGAGMGGLCLAQGLRKAGIAFEVLERDASSDVRGQGFRFRIDTHGDAALRACLPENLYALYQATSNQPAALPSAAYDNQMQVIFSMGQTAGSQSGAGQVSGLQGGLRSGKPQHMAVNRRTLREVLMGGMDNAVHFGAVVRKVEQAGEKVTVLLSDGAIVSGDVLVAADGIGSVVRRERMPHAEPIDTGMRCIYGTTPLAGALLENLPEIFFTGFVPFVGPERRTLAMGPFRSRRPMQEAAAAFAPGVKLTPVPDYLMWLCVAPLESYAINDDELRAADCALLQRKALELTHKWHPTLRRVIEYAETSTLFQVPIRTSPPLEFWTPSRITLLGDAIHAMTPAGGIGANTALRDAALLTELLSKADRGELSILAAIEQYEAEMRVYATAAISSSLESAAKLYQISLPAGRLT